jgi:hypothetical protein
MAFLKDYNSGKKLYEWDGTFLKDYNSGKKVYEFDGIFSKSILIYILQR